MSGRMAMSAPNKIDSRDDATPQFEIGGKYFDRLNERVVQYVQFDSANTVASVNGQAIYWSGYAPTVPTFKVQTHVLGAIGVNAVSSLNFIAGVALGVVTAGNYAFVQTGGRHSTVYVPGTANIGDMLIAGTTDGSVIALTSAAVTASLVQKHVGYCLVAAAASLADCQLVIDPV